jgi:salicylate hydroxylase
MMTEHPILIIGAGIGGLTAALALQRAGFKVAIYEVATELREVGAGLTITPNATHALESLGLGESLAELADIPDGGMVKHYRTGEALVKRQRGDLSLRTLGANYYQMHRADLHNILAEAVLKNDPDCIYLDHCFDTLSQTKNDVLACFTNDVQVRGQALIGCDGLRSAVRASLFIEKPPHFTGQVAWRGLVPADKVPAEWMKPSSSIAVGPGRTFTRYYVRKGTLINYVAVALKDDWREEGWSIRSEISELLDEFSDWHTSMRGIMAATPPDLLYKWALFDREPLTQWSKVRCTLLGDAAHPMLPFLGQGAAMAIEDAVVLGRCFDYTTDAVEAFQRYEDARKPRANDVLIGSRNQGLRFQHANADDYDEEKHKFTDSIKLFGYNAATVPV